MMLVAGGTSVAMAGERNGAPAARPDDTTGNGTSVTGQPDTTPLPGSDVPTPFDRQKNRTPDQRKAGKIFDNVPVDPGPSAPSTPTTRSGPGVDPTGEPDLEPSRTETTVPPKAINPEKPQPPR
jgi:hypothetical protein